jgi:hypothetical protein
MTKVLAAQQLDDKGRCCGRKPLVYKRFQSAGHPAGRFCVRCDRCYDLQSGDQIPNWAYGRVEGGFIELRKSRP